MQGSEGIWLLSEATVFNVYYTNQISLATTSVFDFQLFLSSSFSSIKVRIAQWESHTHTCAHMHTPITVLQANIHSYRSGKGPHETPKACAKFIHLPLRAERVWLSEGLTDINALSSISEHER